MIICGTGHRPPKLGGYGDKVYERLVTLASWWLWAFDHPGMLVISGGALGWDQALATASYHEAIPYHLYLPFPDFDSKWPAGSRKVLEWQCKKAEIVKYTSEPGYAPWKMQVRNEAMVNASDLVLALWDGSDGGTANCVRYAEKVGKKVENLWDRYRVHQ